MSMEILSFGNATMLETVLNGVAMLTTTGNEFNIFALAKLGFLVGLVIVGVGAVVSQKLEPQKLLFGFVMFYFLFVPKETVTVEDVYSGDTAVVANVPIGVAYPMYAITSTGRWLTQAFETVYSIPEGQFKQGYMNALHVLVNVQKVATGPAHLAAERSLNNYIQQCVNYALFDEYIDQASRPTLQTIESAVPMLDGLRTYYVNRDVLTYITSGGLGQNLVQMTCADAYDALASYLSVEFSTEWIAGAAKSVLKFGRNSRDPVDEVQKAATALGIEIRDGYSYMTTALIRNAVKCQSLGECAMLTQKIEQRNVEWGADKSLFLEVARPIMAFIEILVCAVTPLLAFLIGLGPQGVAMGTKYFLMLIWVALWQPLLAICNMYIHIAASQDVAVFRATGVDFESGFGMGNIWESLQSWIATGNMMASSVPGLALMLVYGGSVAATSLAGKMNGGHVDAKAMRPDLIGAGPMVSHGGALKIGANETANAQGGTHVGGAGSPFSVAADSRSMASMVSSRSAAFDQAKSAESRADLAYGKAWEKSAQKSISDVMANSSFSGTSAAQTFESSTGESLSKKNGWSNRQTAAWNVAFGAAADAVASGKMSSGVAAKAMSSVMNQAGIDIGAKGSGQDASSVEEALSRDLSSAASKRASTGVDSGTRKSNTHSDSINQSASASSSVRQGQSYAQAKSERESAGRAYNEALTAQASIGAGFQMSADTLAGVLSNDKGLAAAVADKTGPAFFTPQQLQQFSNRLAAQGNFFHKTPDGAPDPNMVRAYAMVASGRGGELASMIASHGYMSDGAIAGAGVRSASENQGMLGADVGLSRQEHARVQAAAGGAPGAAGGVPKATAGVAGMVGIGAPPSISDSSAGSSGAPPASVPPAGGSHVPSPRSPSAPSRSPGSSTRAHPGAGAAAGSPAPAQDNLTPPSTPNGAPPGRLSEGQIGDVLNPASGPSDSIRAAGDGVARAPTLGAAGEQALKAWNGTWDSLPPAAQAALISASVAYAASKAGPAAALLKNGASAAKSMRAALSNPGVRQAVQAAFQSRASSMGSMNAIPGGRAVVLSAAAAAAAPVLVQAISQSLSGSGQTPSGVTPQPVSTEPPRPAFEGSNAHLIPR